MPDNVVELAAGSKFNKLKGALAKKGARNPAALAAWIGKKKYGAAGFEALAKKGEKKAKAVAATNFRIGQAVECAGETGVVVSRNNGLVIVHTAYGYRAIDAGNVKVIET